MADVTAQRVADELEIRNLVSRVAYLTDNGDLEDYRRCYTPDAVWGEWPGSGASGGQATCNGIEEILEGVRQRRAAGIQGPGTGTQHVVNTVAVRFDSDDVATVKASWQYYGSVTTKPEVLRVGTYDLEVHRTDDGWKFYRRMIGNVANPGPGI